MSKKSRGRCTVNLGRWFSYTAAGAATAFSASNDADAAIYYSGVLNDPVNLSRDAIMTTMGTRHYAGPPFLQPGSNQIGELADENRGFAFWGALGALKSRVAGFRAGNYDYASRLAPGVHVSALNFPPVTSPHFSGAVLNYTSYPGASQWSRPGTSFLAFEFERGSRGYQYGWARLTMDGAPINSFTLVDYAFGSVGQAIVTGQTVVPEPTALGLLAPGAAGLLAARRAWKPSRSHS